MAFGRRRRGGPPPDQRTWIKTSCPACGEDVDVLATGVTAYRDPVSAGPIVGTYWHTCPLCELRVRKPMSAQVEQLLRLGGVRIITLPVQSMHSAGGDQLPPLTLDDLIDAHLLLRDDETTHAVLAALTPLARALDVRHGRRAAGRTSDRAGGAS